MTYRNFLAVACMTVVVAVCAFNPHRGLAQSRNDPANVQKLLRVNFKSCVRE